jgi:hypothetical protein
MIHTDGTPTIAHRGSLVDRQTVLAQLTREALAGPLGSLERRDLIADAQDAARTSGICVFPRGV